MKYLKYSLVFFSFLINILALIFVIDLLNKQCEIAKSKHEVVYLSPEEYALYKEYEYKIFKAEMLLSFFSYINFVIVFVTLLNKHQYFIDKWREFNGVEPIIPYELS